MVGPKSTSSAESTCSPFRAVASTTSAKRYVLQQHVSSRGPLTRYAVSPRWITSKTLLYLPCPTMFEPLSYSLGHFACLFMTKRLVIPRCMALREVELRELPRYMISGCVADIAELVRVRLPELRPHAHLNGSAATVVWSLAALDVAEPNLCGLKRPGAWARRV